MIARAFFHKKEKQGKKEILVIITLWLNFEMEWCKLVVDCVEQYYVNPSEVCKITL